jgi:DNA uptake protein ComE-like DNA-binding protein
MRRAGSSSADSVIAKCAKRAVAAEADALVAIQLDCLPASAGAKGDQGFVPPPSVASRSDKSSRRARRDSFPHSERGSILIIVMWVCFGLVALTLYFANSMNSEMQAAQNRSAEIAARQALEGGERYAMAVLSEYGTHGTIPRIEDYRSESVPVGDGARFWFIGRDVNVSPSQIAPTDAYYALVDEASKLNLNTVTSAMLMALPLRDMTQEYADAIVAWRTANSQAAQLAESYYSQLEEPRHNKGAPYESIDELRLVQGSMLSLILGEDTNRNGLLDANENDGDASAPRDDQDGALLAGLLEYVTVYSAEPTTSASGNTRINVTTLTTQQARQQLQTRMTQVGIAQQRATQIMARFPFNAQNPQATQAPTSVADFMATSQMTSEEWELMHTELTAATGNAGATGLVNVNTASHAVLSAIPGIGPEYADAIVSFRASNPDLLTNFAWLTQVMPVASIRTAGRYITDQSYQFTADVAGAASNGRGYCREKIVIDMRTGKPRIAFRQDLTAYGWALSPATRRQLDGTDNF